MARRYSKKTKPRSNRTKKSRPENSAKLVKTFLEMLNTVKLYHWKTRSFSLHKATDELYSKLNEHIDTFVEILLGKDQSRIRGIEHRVDLLDYNKKRDFQSRILQYRSFLIGLSHHFDSARDTDLLNVRDEILGDINQFLYLMTFDK